ncbi:uncharacterized protein N7484_008461 [Penicillium longicatenatum]|uniref:uncharacterized protein n=1 Tax=Penicillium longicatenatum TaxID=1561947 RepID=UPI002547CD04|nr:uncharacterized protein N7484_008461 [Penicillium longicatenatum]KAJ5635148.1 hypothetical protein N7484_008461 [Penicillium longicatenatum]
MAAANVHVVVDWDLYVPMALNAINSQKLGLGFNPSEVLLGFQPKFFGRSELSTEVLAKALREDIEHLPASEGDLNLSQAVGTAAERLDHMRQKRNAMLACHQLPKPFRPGNLVLLRKAVLDQVKGRKLETRWAGPYKIQKVPPKARSVYLEELATQLRVGKFHFDHLKPFISRSDNQISEAIEVAERNFGQQRFMKEAVKQAVPIDRPQTPDWEL